jgi:hypothetical protein
VWNLSSDHRVVPVVPARKTGGNRSFLDLMLSVRWNDRSGPENLAGTTGTTYLRANRWPTDIHRHFSSLIALEDGRRQHVAAHFLAAFGGDGAR